MEPWQVILDIHQFVVIENVSRSRETIYLSTDTALKFMHPYSK